MEVKLVKLEELDKVMEIINDAKSFLKEQSQQWQQGYPNKVSMKRDIDNHWLFGVYDNDELTCVVALIKGIEKTYVNMIEGKWIIPVTDNDLVIHRIAVSNKYRNKGCAKILMDFALKYAKDNNVKSIKIDTHRANIPMQQLLIKKGYIETGIIDLNRGEEDELRLAFEYVIK